MIVEISDEEAKKAKVPHEIFLTNLIANHILWFVAAIGLAKTYWQPLFLVPVVSFFVLTYILYRAKLSKKVDPWYVMCHWQIAAARCRIFVYMLLLLCAISFFGWLGYTYMGMMEVAVYAIIGGMGILPVMVTVLVLILMESDTLHQTQQHKIPDKMLERFPNPDVVIVSE